MQRKFTPVKPSIACRLYVTACQCYSERDGMPVLYWEEQKLMLYVADTVNTL